MIRSTLKHIIRLLLSMCPADIRRKAIGDIIYVEIPNNTKSALIYLLHLDKKLYDLLGQLSIKYNNGAHVKHRLTGYHQFYIDIIVEGSRVFDVGCGKGFVVAELAQSISVETCRVDFNREHLQYAKKTYRLPDLTFINGDSCSECQCLTGTGWSHSGWNSGYRIFLEETHWTEYTEDSFRDEIAASGMKVNELTIKWGEI